MSVLVKMGRNIVRQTADIIVPPPIVLGADYPPISTLSVLPIQNIARPAYRTWVTDSTYGYDMEIMRVTDNNGVFSNPAAPYVLDPGYSKQQNWNLDHTLFKVGRRFILDAVDDYRYIKSTGTPTGPTFWSNVYANRMWVVGNGKITAWNPLLASASATQFVYDYTSMGYDYAAEWTVGDAEGNITDDDKYILIQTRKTGSSTTWLVKINLETGAIESERSLTSLGITNGVNWSGMSAGGKYIIAAVLDSSGNTLDKKVFDANTWAALGTCGTGDHMDFTYDAFGNEVMTKMNNPRVIDIATKAQIDVIPAAEMVSIYGGSNVGGHSSGQARKLRNWALFSFTSDNNPVKEAFMAKLDGSKQVMRFCPMRYDRYDYSAEAQASPNRDGTMITFASNWLTGVNGSVDTYVCRRKKVA